MIRKENCYISHLLTDREMQQLTAETGMGVESIEFSIAENLDRLRHKVKRYQKKLDFIGCKSLTLHGPFLDLNPVSYDAKIAGATRERYEQVYEAAQWLGAEKIIFHSCFLPQIYYLEGWVERTAEFWNDFLREKKGIQILLENVYDREIVPLTEVKDRVESPEFMLCLDVGHAHCYSAFSVEQWITRMGERIGHVHLHDNWGQKDSHLALSRGNIPWKKIFPLLETLGGQVSYTLECNFSEDVQLSWEFLQQNRNFRKQNP